MRGGENESIPRFELLPPPLKVNKRQKLRKEKRKREKSTEKERDHVLLSAPQI